MIELACFIAATIWVCLLLAPGSPWRIRERLDCTSPASSSEPLDHITVLIPARNEAEHIKDTLHSLQQQGENLHVILVDDQSEDQTAEIAANASMANLTIVAGQALPDGWAGKLWALQQGLEKVTTKYIVLLDADIQLEPGLLHTVANKSQQENLDFVSLMVQLRMQSGWEKLLIPAFIYFFKLIYPFALSNNPNIKRFAAAAGGFIFTRTEVLQSIGAFSSLRNAIIDDCTLAKQVKNANYKTWIGLTQSASSLRRYETLSSIWNMVARTAFTQLHYSTLLLLITTVLMFFVYWLPITALISGEAIAPAIIAINLMWVCYWPTIRYYHLSFLWCLTLPLSAVLFLLMTWASAFRYWQGSRSTWKGRVYLR